MAIKHAPQDRQNELAQQLFKHILFMAKQNRMIENKIASLRTARQSKAATNIVEKRALELIAVHRKQLKILGEHLHRLNLALAKSHSKKRAS